MPGFLCVSCKYSVCFLNNQESHLFLNVLMVHHCGPVDFDVRLFKSFIHTIRAIARIVFLRGAILHVK